MTSEYINQVPCINIYLVWIMCLCKQEHGFSAFLFVSNLLLGATYVQEHVWTQGDKKGRTVLLPTLWK